MWGGSVRAVSAFGGRVCSLPSRALLRLGLFRVTAKSGRLSLVLGRRVLTAMAVALAGFSVTVCCYRFDALGLFRSEPELTCPSLGLPDNFCALLQGHRLPQSLYLPLIFVAAFTAFGFYDPRPLLLRLERSRRSPWWLAVSAAGVSLILAPYLLAAAGVRLALFSPLSPFLFVSGVPVATIGLLLWLSNRNQLDGTLKPHQVLAVLALMLGPVAFQDLGAEHASWDFPFLRTVTFDAVVFLLKLAGESPVFDPIRATVEVKNFGVLIASPCSGIAGIFMVSAVVAGYILASCHLKIGRAWGACSGRGGVELGV